MNSLWKQVGSLGLKQNATWFARFFFTCYTFSTGFLFQSINSLTQNCLRKPKMKLLGLSLRPSFMWSVIYSLRNRLYPYCFNNGEPWDLGTSPQRRCESSESSCKRKWPTCHLVFQSPSFLVALKPNGLKKTMREKNNLIWWWGCSHLFVRLWLRFNWFLFCREKFEDVNSPTFWEGSMTIWYIPAIVLKYEAHHLNK